MTPFRIVIASGCLLLLAGAGYLSWTGAGAGGGSETAQAASVRTGSPGTGSTGGYGFFGRVK